jgi:hypothetical protein
MKLDSPTLAGSVNMQDETASTIAQIDGSKNIKSLATSTYPSLTELSYVKGLTSAVQTQLNSRLSQDIYISGLWNIPPTSGSLASTSWHTAAYYIPFIVHKTTTFTDIGIIVSTGAASATVRIGLYNSSAGDPTTVIYQTAALDASTTGFKSETFLNPITLTPGLYFRVGQTSASGVGLRYGNLCYFIGNPSDSVNQGMKSQTRSYGAFTDNPTTVYLAATNGILIFLKVQ